MAKKHKYRSPMIYDEIDLATEVAEAKRRFEECLLHAGFRPFTARPVVKIKPMKRARGNHADSFAVYRGGSAIMGSPIFWVSDKFVETAEEYDLDPMNVVECLLDTLCHEYGHALCDLLQLGDRRNGTDNYRRLVLARHRGDEEVFAEEFGLCLAGSRYFHAGRKRSALTSDTIEEIKEALGGAA